MPPNTPSPEEDRFSGISDKELEAMFEEVEGMSEEELAAANTEVEKWLASQDPLDGLSKETTPGGTPVLDLLKGEEQEAFIRRLKDTGGWNEGEVPSV